MSDEVIESVYEGKKDYTLSIYVKIQSKLVDRIKAMNANSKVVLNAEMLGKALWVSAILE